MDLQSIWKLLTKGSTVQLKLLHITPCEVCTVVVGFVYNGVKYEYIIGLSFQT